MKLMVITESGDLGVPVTYTGDKLNTFVTGSDHLVIYDNNIELGIHRGGKWNYCRFIGEDTDSEASQ